MLSIDYHTIHLLLKQILKTKQSKDRDKIPVNLFKIMERKTPFCIRLKKGAVESFKNHQINI